MHIDNRVIPCRKVADPIFLSGIFTIPASGSITKGVDQAVDLLHQADRSCILHPQEAMQQPCLQRTFPQTCKPCIGGRRHEIRQRQPVVVCAGDLRKSVQQRVHNAGLTTAAVVLSGLCLVGSAVARLEGVNKPELLPKEFSTVIDVAGFLTEGEELRIKKEIQGLERDKGVKLRVLAQNYPNTPGLAIKDFWGVDADTVVFVADPGLGNILNFNVGQNVDLMVPSVSLCPSSSIACCIFGF
ncbi:hypothetical protein ABBQ38_000617 [Trebouxia sp. C0009 RCD-2024]